MKIFIVLFIIASFSFMFYETYKFVQQLKYGYKTGNKKSAIVFSVMLVIIWIVYLSLTIYYLLH